ncbi:MAG TPA: hypothetical protein VHR42_02605 [Clostridia bacterium]|nr:hypothetical protein [Clostridia bacterium]
MAGNMPESENDFMQMQQEAIRRVRQMQERARRTLESAGMHIDETGGESQDGPPAAPPIENPAVGPAPRRVPSPSPGHQRIPLPLSGQSGKQPPGIPDDKISIPILNIAVDSDQMLLVLLMYLLIKDGADQWLILSLAYVLLT